MEYLLCLVIVILPLSSALYSSVTWHSAPYQYEDLLQEDSELLEVLEQGIYEEGYELSEYRDKITERYEVTKSQSSQDFEHPVKYFRSKNIWDTSENFESVEKLDNFLLEYYLLLKPGLVDKKAVLQNLYSLQKSHGLKTEDLANGVICGRPDHEMSADDCIDMGLLAGNKNNRALKIKWYEEAKRKILKGKKSRYRLETVNSSLETLYDRVTCDEMCKQDQEIVKKQLECKLWDNFGDPWMMLQPVKMEVLETEPSVYRFYDVISDKEIRRLKDLTWGKLVDAKTAIDADDPVELQSPRVAHHYFHDDEDDILLQVLKRRIEGITGLNLDKSESLQVATYGIGGHYVAHTDASDTGIPFDEDLARVATFMLYLSAVENGGSTVFLHPQIAIKPQKGSAIFWYNLLPSGQLDQKTLHCACPILIGNKWIANQWIKQGPTGICTDQKGMGRLKN